MKIDDLVEELLRLKLRTKNTLKRALNNLGGEHRFVTADSDELNECDDVSDLDLPLVRAFSYNYNDGNYYVTRVALNYGAIEIYGVPEGMWPIVEDNEVQEAELVYIFVDGMIDIIEKLPEA